MKVIALVPDDAVSGFKLAGCNSIVSDRSRIIDTLLQFKRDPLLAVIFVDERLLEGVSPEELERIDAIEGPVISVIPSPEGRVEEFMIKYLRRILGYHVRV